MMKIFYTLVALILAGCAAAPEKLESVGRAESAKMRPPTKRFSSYASYELRPMVLGESVKQDERKVTVAGDLENVLRTKIQPLINSWRASAAAGRSGTLVIEPQLVNLKVVSSTARFWAGAFAGDSRIDMELLITDKSNGQQIANPYIGRSAGAFTGGWSIGKSDQNLLDYIASMTYQYLADNY
jgi:hypothetical protein